VTIGRASGLTLSAIRTRVRDEVGDRATYPDGSAISSGALRWTDTQIDRAVVDELLDLGTELSGRDAGESLLSADLTYASPSTALPAGVGYEGVAKVEDITDTNNPIVLDAASHLEQTPIGHYRYHFIGSATGNSIVLRPQPVGGRSLRIWYDGNPLVYTPEDGTANDTHPLSPRWREVVYLGAALRLLRVGGEATDDQRDAYKMKREQFDKFAKRQRAPKRVRRQRKGFS
jgi:hypothetical protein